MTMNQHDDTPPRLADERVRRLRELLGMMVGLYGDQGPMVARIRRNLAHAEAADADARKGPGR